MVPPSESVPIEELARRAPALRNGQGRQFEAAGQIDQAMAAYRQALDFDPVYPPAAANLARLLVAGNRPAEAAALLEPVAAAPIDLPPKVSDPSMNRAISVITPTRICLPSSLM